MTVTLSVLDFTELMDTYNCGFTYSGAEALFDFFEEIDENMECDPVAIRCEYTEYENLEDFHNTYDAEDYPDFDSISDNTILILTDSDSFIIQDF